MKTIRPFTLAVLLSAALSAPAWAGEADTSKVGDRTLPLFGIGVAQELRTGLYIGALYLPEGSKLDSALDNTQVRRLTLKMLPERFSAREWSKHWKPRITMNNPAEVWKANLQAIAAFGDVFKDGLQRGDRVDIDHVPGTPLATVNISLNGQRVASLRSAGLFNMLLSTWIGDIPATQVFKSGITGKLDAKVVASIKGDFDAMVATPRAIAALDPEPEVKAEPPKPEPAKPVEKVAEKAAAPKTPEKPADKVAEKTVAAKPEPAKAEPVKSESAAAQTSAAQAIVSQPPAPQVAPHEPAPVEIAKTDVAKTELAAVPGAAKPEAVATEPVIDADLLLGDYRRRVMPLFKQIYPKAAYKERLEGSGTVRATIDRNGEILEVEVVETTGQRLLDRGMRDIITRSGPLPAVPAELPGESFTIDLPVTFKLAEETR